MNNSPGLKVLQFASGDLWAGAEVQLYTLVSALHTLPKVSVSVVLLNQGTLADKLIGDGIEVTVLDESSLNGFQILSRLVRLIKDQRPDIIHTHRGKENVLGSIAGLLAGGVPSIRTAHGAPEHHPSILQIHKHIIRFFDWFSGRYLQKRIIAVSEDLAHILKKSFPSKKIRIIENGLDLEIIKSQGIRQTPGLIRHTGVFKIGLAGRLVSVKRADLFIQSARYILNHYAELKASFHIYGEGPMRSNLENLNKELGTEAIIYFEGHCDDMPQKLQELDVIILTSDHEGLPMILLEAMALQTPIIAHAVGGIPKLLDYGTCGILIKEQNADSYAQEIFRLSQSPQVRTDIANNALERVQSIYSADQNARAYILNYSQIRQNSI